MQPFSCGSRIWFSVRRHEQGHERKQLEEWLGQSNSPFERQTDKLYNWKTISQLTRTNCVFWRTLCSWKNDWCRWRLQREERLGPVTTVEGRTRADNSGVGKMTKADNSAGTDVGAHYILWQILVACCPVLYFIISRYDGGLVQLLAPSCRVADLQPETMWPTKGRQLVRRTIYEYKGIISASDVLYYAGSCMLVEFQYKSSFRTWVLVCLWGTRDTDKRTGQAKLGRCTKMQILPNPPHSPTPIPAPCH